MGQGHRGVAGQQHHGHGPPDHQAATEHHHPLALNGNVVEVQGLQTGPGRGRGKALPRIGEHPGQRCRADAVDVLFRGQSIAHGPLVHGGGQGAEHEAAVDAVVGVHRVDHRFQLALGGIGRQLEAAHGEPQGLGPLARGALVGQIVRTLPHAHDGQRRSHADRGQALDAGRQIVGQGRRHFLASEQLRHYPSLSTTSAYTSSARALPAAMRSSICSR